MSPATPINVEAHFSHFEHLLKLEADAEKEIAIRDAQRFVHSESEASGTVLHTLVIREEDTGFGGRSILTLGKRNQNLSLPWTRLNTGTPVLFSEEGQQHTKEALQSWRGIVTRLQADTIQIALQTWMDSESEAATFRLERAGDEISRQRMRQAMETACEARNSRLADLRDILLGISPACYQTTAYFAPFNSGLNSSQLEAVRFALSAEDLAILHGPPGTGKTTTLVELIRQLVHRGQRVLAVAPSHMGVDNLLEQLLASGEKALRLGHPARVLAGNRSVSLDEQVENHPDMKLVQKLMREARQLYGQADRYTRAKPEPGSRKELRAEAKQLTAEARKIERQIVSRILENARVICATATGLDESRIGDLHFDWCVFDEASQAVEPAVWIPLQYADRLVLAGDPYQLPPTVVSRPAAAQGLQISMMERLIGQLGQHTQRMLTVQYRMHQEIMAFSGDEFYQSKLTADSTVAAHLLKDLPGIGEDLLCDHAVEFIDTAGASFDETLEPDGESRYNEQEAQWVVRKVQALRNLGLPAESIGVISPYSAQVRLLRSKLPDLQLEIDSVDGFQGREKEAVIVSLVRSNPENEIGFLEDVRRMNVALTRARRKLIVIGDSATITIHPFYQRMVTYFESIGAYRSVWEEM
jgi:superfamily I DNA and/or RNA helicase